MPTTTKSFSAPGESERHSDDRLEQKNEPAESKATMVRELSHQWHIAKELLMQSSVLRVNLD